ncbi:TetR/AcrR family transcriptional regulator [Lutibacter sp. B2]|nr:TetR/AcrR family transcriptional regulator [Lutibacter sp. B2]
MRQRIIEAAIHETAARGMKFTMNDLAKRLGVSKRTIYENFSSKESIVDAMIENFLNTMSEKEEKILSDSNLSEIDQLKAIGMIFADDFQLMYISKLFDMKTTHPNQWKKIEYWLNGWRPESKLIQKGMEKNKLRTVNVIVLRKIIIESMLALFDSHFLMKNDITFKEAMESMMDILLYGVVNQ